MSWGDVKKGSGKFVLLKDGESVTGVPVGEPVKRLNKFGGKRYYINFLVSGEAKMSILPMSVTAADDLKKALLADDPKKSLVGRTAVKIARSGAKMDTVYNFSLCKLSPSEQKALAKVETIDLEECDLGEEVAE